MFFSLLTSNAHVTRFAAIQLVMMQASTSLMFRKALTSPGIAPQSMPARMPPRKASSQISQPGSAPEGMLSAIKSVASVPMRYCPGAPMLNRPVLNASATERPVMTSGVARKSILPMLAGLKPQVSAPFASRPVERMPMKIRRMPSHAPLREMLLLKMPTIRTTASVTRMMIGLIHFLRKFFMIGFPFSSKSGTPRRIICPAAHRPS